MELDFQSTFIIALRFSFCEASVSVKMNANGNMIEERRGKALSRVLKSAVPKALFQAFRYYWKCEGWEAGKLQGARAYSVMILALRCLELCMFGSEVSDFRAHRAVFKLFSLCHWVAGFLLCGESIWMLCRHSPSLSFFIGWACDKYPCAMCGTCLLISTLTTKSCQVWYSLPVLSSWKVKSIQLLSCKR